MSEMRQAMVRTLDFNAQAFETADQEGRRFLIQVAPYGGFYAYDQELRNRVGGNGSQEVAEAVVEMLEKVRTDKGEVFTTLLVHALRTER